MPTNSDIDDARHALHSMIRILEDERSVQYLAKHPEGIGMAQLIAMLKDAHNKLNA